MDERIRLIGRSVDEARRRAAGRLRVLLRADAGLADARSRRMLRDILREADEVVLVPEAERGSVPVPRGRDAADVYSALREGRSGVFLARSEQDALEHACRSWREGDATCHVGCGEDAGAAPSWTAENPVGVLLPEIPAERRIWIGQGTNTWRSDLDLGERYERTSGPADVAGASLGIPWMAGIPGTVGGWIRMNAGAFGHSFSEALEAVRVDGVWRSAASCGFAYRRSAIEGEIQDFRLRPRGEIVSEGDVDWYLARRRRFPARTFGSFFRNPEGDFAGRILEEAGAKSLRVGGAYVWSEHANVVVEGDGATPSDVLALARMMVAVAYESSGVRLEPEVCGTGLPLAFAGQNIV